MPVGAPQGAGRDASRPGARSQTGPISGLAIQAVRLVGAPSPLESREVEEEERGRFPGPKLANRDRSTSSSCNYTGSLSILTQLYYVLVIFYYALLFALFSACVWINS